MVSFSTIRAADDAGGHRARDGQPKIVQPVTSATGSLHQRPHGHHDYARDEPVLHVTDLILCEVNNTQPDYVELQPLLSDIEFYKRDACHPRASPGLSVHPLGAIQRNCRRHAMTDQRCWPRFRRLHAGLPRGGIGTRVEWAELGLDP